MSRERSPPPSLDFTRKKLKRSSLWKNEVQPMKQALSLHPWTIILCLPYHGMFNTLHQIVTFFVPRQPHHGFQSIVTCHVALSPYKWINGGQSYSSFTCIHSTSSLHACIQGASWFIIFMPNYNFHVVFSQILRSELHNWLNNKLCMNETKVQGRRYCRIEGPKHTLHLNRNNMLHIDINIQSWEFLLTTS